MAGMGGIEHCSLCQRQIDSPHAGESLSIKPCAGRDNGIVRTIAGAAAGRQGVQQATPMPTLPSV